MDLKLIKIGEYEEFDLYFCNEIKSPLSTIKIKNKGYSLVAGTTYDYFSQEEIYAIYLHEKGHINSGEFSNNIEAEFKADVFSASIVGGEKYIDILKKGNKLFNENESNKMIEKRINLLRDYFKVS